MDINKDGIKLRNIRSEVLLIKVFCKCKSKLRTYILTNIQEDYFSTKIGSIIWKKAKELHLKKALPNKSGWEVLRQDKVLYGTSAIRELMQEFDTSKVVSKRKFVDELLHTMDFFNQKRQAFYAIQKAYSNLVEVENNSDISSALVPIISTARGLTEKNQSENIFQLDKTHYLAYLKHRRETLKESGVVHTLWPSFDSVNTGLSFGSLVTIAATTGGGKCIKNGLVPTNEGLKYIKDLWNECDSTIDKDGFKKLDLVVKSHLNTINKAKKIYNTEGKTIKIKTYHGDEIEGLKEHKLYSIGNKGKLVFKQLAELKRNDWLVKSIGERLFPKKTPSLVGYKSKYEDSPTLVKYKDFIKPSKLTIELSKIFGFMVSEGDSSLRFCQQDNEIGKLYSKLIKEVFNSDRKFNGIVVCNQFLISEFLSKYIGNHKSAYKYVPSIILQSPEKFQIAFLQALFEGDGSIWKEKSQNRFRIEYYTISKRLAYEVKAMIENMGISCVLKPYKAFATNGSETQKPKQAYAVAILKDSYCDFINKIGFISTRKRKIQNECYKHYSNYKHNSSRLSNMESTGLSSKMPGIELFNELINIIEVVCKDTKRYNKEMYCSYAKYTLTSIFGTKGYFYKKRSGCLTKLLYQQLLDDIKKCIPSIKNKIYKNKRALEIISLLNSYSGLYWTKINSKKYINKISKVYDFNIPVTHSYSVNGLISHNSAVTGMNMMFNFCCQGFNVSKASLEMPKEQLAERSAAYASGIPLHKIRRFNLTEQEQNHLQKCNELLNKTIEDSGGSYWVILPPDKDISMEEALTLAYEKGKHIILIDYINLLKKDKKQDMRDKLDEDAKTAKMFAKANNCLVILLAQLNIDDHVKYAQAIEEHCVVGDSLVDTEKGLVTIDSILPSDSSIDKISANIDINVTTAYGIRKAKKWYKKGTKDCIAIKTKVKGFQITGSTTTKVLVLNKNLSMGWKSLNEITKNDYIAIKRKCYCWNKDIIFDKIFNGSDLSYDIGYTSPNKMTPELAKVCGYLVAEGHIKKAGISFCTGNEKVAKEYTKLFNKLFNANKKYFWANKANAFYIRTQSRIISDFFSYIGLKGDSRSKEVPWSVLQSSKECAIAFLQGYCEEDMSKDYAVVTYSKNLAKQLQILFLKLNIVVKVQSKKDKYNRVDKTKSNKYWYIFIQGNDRNIFNNIIGLKYRKTSKISRSSLLDKIPFLNELLAEFKVGRNSYKTENGLNRIVKLKKYLGTNITYDKLNKKGFLKELKKHFPSLYVKIKLINETHYYWDKIKTIKNKKEVVYDFTVDKCGNEVVGEGSFIANGIVVHNSDNLFIWRYPPDDRPGYIKVQQKKARQQIIYDFYLVEDFAHMRVYDILDPVGLSLLFSKSSGKSLVSKASEYFGIRKLNEMKSIKEHPLVPHHTFIKDINFDDFITSTIPNPNAPDISEIVDMVRETINNIAMYEPEIALAHIENLKTSNVLKPYIEYLSDLDLPLEAKKLLGLIVDSNDKHKKEILMKIDQDLLNLTQNLYVETDKRIRDDRTKDLVTSRTNEYEDDFKQLNGKKPKVNKTVNPSTNKSKWMHINPSFIKHKGNKQATEIEKRVDHLSILKNTEKIESLKKVADSGKSKKVLLKHWKKLHDDTPDSMETMLHNLLNEKTSTPPSFLSSIEDVYWDKYNSHMRIVHNNVLNRCENVEKKKSIIASSFTSKEWCKGVKFKDSINALVIDTLNKVSVSLPNNGYFTNFENSKIDKALHKLKNVNNHVNNIYPTELISKVINSDLSNNLKYKIKPLNKKVLVSKDLMLAEKSPYISLYAKPESIGLITPYNIHLLINPNLTKTIIKKEVLDTIKKVDNRSREYFLRSIAWSLVNSKYRHDTLLLLKVKIYLMMYLKINHVLYKNS